MRHHIALFTSLAMSLLATASRADWPPPCDDVPACVALAERTPSQFSIVLGGALRRLPAPVLVAGLSWKHERPEVTKQGRTQLLLALQRAGGHTKESAGQLLDFVLREKPPEGPLSWMRVLSLDRAGLEVLGERIDSGFEDPINDLAAMLYVEALTDADGAWSRSPVGSLPDTPERTARVQRCVEHLWSTWLQRRSASSEGSALRTHVLRTHAYKERIAALIRGELTVGRTPRQDEFDAFVGTQSSKASFLLELLTWSEGPDARLRKMASETLLGFHVKVYEPADRSRVRRALLSLLPGDSDDTVEMVADRLLDPNAETLPSEAERLAEAVRKLAVERESVMILAELSEQFPQFRPELLERIFGSDLDLAERTIDALPEGPLPKLRAELAAWVLGLTTEQLRDETIQEQFLIVATALSRSDYRLTQHLELPESRRSREVVEFHECGTAVLAAQGNARSESADLKAFGLPTTSVHYPRFRGIEKTRTPPAPPMTPAESEARFQQFSRALRALQARISARKPS